MADDRLITLAIHTYDHAVALKNLLESEGVESVLQNVNLEQPVVSSGIRVRIHESDLPQALRIIENTDIFLNPEYTAADYTQLILVPIDFSEHSLAACDIAFRLANRLKANIVLLNSYLDPYFAGNIQLSDAAEYDIADTEMRQILKKDAVRRMDSLKEELKSRIKDNKLPAVKFTTEIAEGLPEEVIAEYAKQKKPELIVMGTRGADKKEKELIGSVTAEVLDSCRFPVFTLPESVKLEKIEDIRHVLFFNNLDQEDILAIDALARTFSKEHLEVTLVNIPSKKLGVSGSKPLKVFMSYCMEHYPTFTYNTAELSLSTITEDFTKIQQRQKIDLIVVPNKKKNIFARFFNPSLAHRLLFHSDIPMMVIPV